MAAALVFVLCSMGVPSNGAGYDGTRVIDVCANAGGLNVCECCVWWCGMWVTPRPSSSSFFSVSSLFVFFFFLKFCAPVRGVGD